ncbi:DUF7577 domain-containing protein [Natronomonas sp. EA1]|uniref:DUF7577 domain-containing protein n=1 Tax=Natronomonas sp. EA1 TaxID=3421655 RepID=UPI003EBD92A8
MIDSLPLGTVAVLAGLFVAHLVLFAIYLRKRSSGGSATGPVACEECGTTNEPGYAFCGTCAARLPATGVAHERGDGVGSRAD